jgi:hypothetical protein
LTRFSASMTLRKMQTQGISETHKGIDKESDSLLLSSSNFLNCLGVERCKGNG